MTELLLRLFVKDHGNISAPETYSAIGRMAGITGIVCNAFLFLAKLTVGVIAGSISILADSINNLSDVASSAVTFLGFRLAQHPADEKHPYGYARCEYLSGLAVAVMIFVIGFQLAKSSVEKIIYPAATEFTLFTFVVLIISIAIKAWMFLFFKTLDKHIHSPSLKATSADCRNDVISTVAVLFSCFVGFFAQVNIDGYIGLAVAVFIFCSGFQVAEETISPLLGKQADKELSDRISNFVLSHERVLGVHDLLVHDYGPGQCFASVHVELSSEEDPLVCHNIIDDIECKALEELKVHLVIHHDPIAVNNSEWNEMRQILEEIIEDISPEFSMHGFRIVTESGQSKLVFDLTVPYSMNSMRAELKTEIDKALTDKGKKYITIIRFDGK